jgi:hypothetical protein
MTDRYERLVAHISHEMANDDEDQSQMLADIYLAADDAGKDVLDRAFICLCGWQLQTLMKQVDKGDSSNKRESS